MRLEVRTVERPDGTKGRRYYLRGLPALISLLVWSVGVCALLLGPIPNPHFPIALNVAKGVLLDGAAVLILAITRRYTKWLGLTIWQDGTVSFRYYVRYISLPADQVSGLRLMTGWPWRTLLDRADGETESVHGLPAAPSWLPRRRQRANELLHHVWHDIREIGGAEADIWSPGRIR